MKIFVVVTALLGLSVTALPAHAAPHASVRKIGVLMFSEETRYYEAAQGFRDQLGKEGFRESKIKFFIENAGGNKGKAAELVQQFAADRMDLIVTLGTSATVAVAREIKDVPIVFAMVYDPLDAGIVRDWKSSGNNTTGASSRISMAVLIGRLKELAPVKRLAVLYTPGEKNSETQLKDLQKVQARFGITVIPVPLTSREEVADILPDVGRTADAIYVSGSNLVDSQIATIVEVSAGLGIVTVTHLEDLVEKGMLLGVCPEPYTLGTLAAKKAIRIFKGAHPSSLPIDTLQKLDVIVNMRTARAAHFAIAPRFMKKVTRVIE